MCGVPLKKILTKINMIEYKKRKNYILAALIISS